MRVLLFVGALVAMPLAAGAAQGQSGGNANANADNRCKNSPQAGRNEASQRGAAAAAQAQLHKNCSAPVVPPPPPPPASEPPPSGIHKAKGVVYEDVDANGAWDMFAGEMGLFGWTVQLYWNGQQVGSMSTDADGNYEFSGLGNAWYTICVVPQAGYVRTEPVNGNACGGDGRLFELNSPFESWGGGNYGYRIP